MILDIAQIAPPELDQKMQRKSSAAKVSIWLCGELALNCDASTSLASRQPNLYRIVPGSYCFEGRKRKRTLPL